MSKIIRPKIHVVAYGEPGSGKTQLMATFPKPMIVFQFDPFGKESPYHRRGVLDPTEYEGEHGQPIELVKSKNHPEKTIVQIEKFWEEDPQSPVAYGRFRNRMASFWAEVREGMWASAIIDGVTFMELVKRKEEQYLLNKATKEPRQWYASTTESLEEMLMMRFGSLRCNVGITAHVDKDKDELHGFMVFNPAAPGRMRTRFGAGFPEMYHSYVKRNERGEVRYLLQTRSDHRFNAASVQLGAPDPLDITDRSDAYTMLFENYDKENAA